MTSIGEDFKILRNQVSKEHYSDADLKTLFFDNNYDIVKCLLIVEEKISGRKAYTIEGKHLTEAQKKIKELREIADEKDKIVNSIKKRVPID